MHLQTKTVYYLTHLQEQLAYLNYNSNVRSSCISSTFAKCRYLAIFGFTLFTKKINDIPKT